MLLFCRNITFCEGKCLYTVEIVYPVRVKCFYTVKTTHPARVYYFYTVETSHAVFAECDVAANVIMIFYTYLKEK